MVGYLVGGSLGVMELWLGQAMLLLAVVVAVGVSFYLAYR